VKKGNIMKRGDGRAWNELRPVKITTGYQNFTEGSVLIEMGSTRVLCAVSVEDRVPQFMRGRGIGWVTAEYAMLPSSTPQRTARESHTGRISGRSHEIQRLIGRSLRAVTDMEALGERTFTIDCDVIQADGGTRTAAITGAYVALYAALRKLSSMGIIRDVPLRNAVAAVSVGVVRNTNLLDLCYDEDSAADVDFNVVMTDRGDFVELQGTAEQKPFPRDVMDSILSVAEKGIRELFEHQQAAISALSES